MFMNVEGINAVDVKTKLQYVQLSKSDIFGILQNDRRRCVLELLREKGSLSVRSLSEEIARIEAGSEEPKSSTRKSIYVSLIQNHIPKMESLGIVVYNREQDSVELLPTSRNFDIYMETVKKGDIPWSQFYLGFSVLTIFGNVAIYEGFIEWISSFQWMIFASMVFLSSSLVNHVHVRRYEE